MKTHRIPYRRSRPTFGPVSKTIIAVAVILWLLFHIAMSFADHPDPGGRTIIDTIQERKNASLYVPGRLGKGT